MIANVGSQRCLLLSGRCVAGSDEDFITASSTDTANPSPFPSQNWPVSEGRFKSLLILSPGTNFIVLQHYKNGQATGNVSITINYVPLLQTPPLLLAIMIAKDSPLLIDCPPNKQGTYKRTFWSPDCLTSCETLGPLVR
jgi:hypothetical protein